MHTVEGQPLTGSPKINVLITIIKIIINAIIENIEPKMEAICKGPTLKAVIPSKEYLNNFQKDHLVSPATLSTFSNSIHFVSKPIQPKIPLEKRLIVLH